MHININNIGLFFHGKTSVPSAEMVDALARCISNNKFQIKPSLKKGMVNSKKLEMYFYLHTNTCIYHMLFNVKFTLNCQT